MTDEQKFEYVVIGYAADALCESVKPIAILGWQHGGKAVQSLTMRIAKFMPVRITAERQEYLLRLFESWKETAVAELDGLFQELRGLSAGQLRACCFGSCPIADFPRVAEQALGFNGDLDKRSLFGGGDRADARRLMH